MIQTILTLILATINLLLFSGSVYELSSIRSGAMRYLPRGNFYRLLDGTQLQYQLAGNMSSPFTVVLESGLGCPSVYWESVIAGLVDDYRVIWYDRAGYGHSDQSHGSSDRRTSSKIVDELYELLSGLGLTSNLILVGHSFGGTNVQLFAARYRESVAGMVLVDSSHPDMFKKMIPTPLDGQSKAAKSLLLARFMSSFGLTRLQLTHLMPKIFTTLASMVLVVLCQGWCGENFGTDRAGGEFGTGRPGSLHGCCS